MNEGISGKNSSNYGVVDMKEKRISLLPNASSLIESMRSIGYSFETAIADIVDNSISANAKCINIFLQDINDEPIIQIIDDGKGMTNKELLEAMRLGSKNPNQVRDENDLGRFGLGLKSASFSQCKTLTVVSKQDCNIHAYKWDLDIVATHNKFEVIELSNNDILDIKNIGFLDDFSSGTLVQWEDFDRINESTSSLGDELITLMDTAIEHMALIYHRFIDEGLAILVNNTKLPNKDPFLTDNPLTDIRPEKTVTIEGKVIKLYPYVLPYFSKLSAEDKRRSGKTNEQYKSQGFYLYRNKRLIIWGDYLGLDRKSELTKNLRIQVDIPNNLDYMWEIDIKKSRASVPSKIKKNLLSAISDGKKVSKRLYTFRGNKEIGEEQSVWNYISDRDGEFRFEINKENNVYQTLVGSLNSEQEKLLMLLMDSIGKNMPIQKIYAEMADGHKLFVDTDESIQMQLQEFLDFADTLGKDGGKQLVKTLLVSEPYRTNRQYIEIINDYLSQ